MILPIVATVLCLFLLFLSKLNRGQEIEYMLYQHKFIPKVLGKYVKVK
ncbi:hypothetical protein [Phthorimaea operculella granulovirus]|uniref:Uncharacterized protein n=1 Tax=Phthorimaea operculella granulovirus TaxID=192584 RepID=Q8JS11_9BBAC|nr:hypothetical protein [Phthorimaea operculella granulovirus]AAM70246.1 hypothetical protein [Phthorimaea operculella granulovirus]ANY57437.1 hypothetical protein PhopGVgp048 [Phthorimaea operculella granulovirus]QBH65883.1 hypothetical protein PhopGVgp048 [Phthorimaea operculella granulovirus]QBH66013.1 hypothetical protein PhopGVgp048 [Phthorimaea operculella granulovirus]QBH66143.1 hypothetical protein PhopGVgp048 [Phthorimaea operculella granulovirus]